ncbi:MAG: integron integrase, partial [bacterium]
MRHLSAKTERAYAGWIRRYITFHRRRHPRDMAEREVASFLTMLAVDGHVAASTQNQALAALLFLYRDVLGMPMTISNEVVRAKRPKRLPDVMSRGEVANLLAELEGVAALGCLLLYGSGLRLQECISLRVKDVDVAERTVIVRGGKGNKDRRTILSDSAAAGLARHLPKVRRLHAADLAAGHGAVALPHALVRKYPGVAVEWGWQWIFPASRRYVEDGTRIVRRHHIDPTVLQRAVAAA